MLMLRRHPSILSLAWSAHGWHSLQLVQGCRTTQQRRYSIWPGCGPSGRRSMRRAGPNRDAAGVSSPSMRQHACSQQPHPRRRREYEPPTSGSFRQFQSLPRELCGQDQGVAVGADGIGQCEQPACEQPASERPACEQPARDAVMVFYLWQDVGEILFNENATHVWSLVRSAARHVHTFCIHFRSGGFSQCLKDSEDTQCWTASMHVLLWLRKTLWISTLPHC